MRFTTSAAALAASLSIASAQTFTQCNPLEKTCPQNTGLPAKVFTSDFTDGKGASASWSTAAYSTINYGSNGAEFSIDAAKQAPTIETDFYIFFGRIDVKMRAAPGTGIVSSIVLESDDLDEIDWEFLGGNTAQVESNFFGKGNTTAYDRAIYYPVDTPQDTFHTYTIDWNSERLLFIIDGVTVRTLGYNDPLTIGGTNYPQTPMKLKLGNWCGGCKGEPKGTVAWAGGETTFEGSPYVMYVESVNIQNYNPADSYEWTDNSGSWQSIKIINGGQSSDPSGAVSGKPSVSATGNQTVAPTKGHTVPPVMNTEAAVSKTLTGKYGSNSTGTATRSIKTSIVMQTTQVPGSQPSGSGPGGVSPGTSLGSGNAGGSASNSALPSVGTNGAVANGVASSTTLLGLLLSVLFL